LRAQSRSLRAQSRGLRAQSRGLRAQRRSLRAQSGGLCAQSRGFCARRLVRGARRAGESGWPGTILSSPAPAGLGDAGLSGVKFAGRTFVGTGVPMRPCTAAVRRAGSCTFETPTTKMSRRRTQ
jgi:hypothetical protein